MTHADRKAHTIALVDLGSNSVRLMVVRINPSRSHTVLTQHKEMVRLGEGAFTAKRLTEAAMRRTIGALRNIAEICRGYDVEETMAYATAAVRDAKNGADFVERAECESGIRLAVISGLEEARLIHLGVSTGLINAMGDRTGFFIDIGGGSTEMIVGRGTHFLHLDSLKLGAVRVTNTFPETSGKNPVSQGQYDKIRSHIRNNSLRSVQKMSEYAPEIMVGSSGTIQSLTEIAYRNGKNGPRPKNGEAASLSLKALAEIAQKLCSVNTEDRKKVPGMNPQRADIIIGGAAILQTLMEEIGIGKISVSNRGLLDGMLQDYLTRGTWGYLDASGSVREQSVLQLARTCSIDETHARWMAGIACSLFDSAGKAGLHHYGPQERELLYYAALLHDVGLFLSFSNHHAHTRYIIANSELLGFSRDEIDIMALAAFFHRKRSSKKKRRRPSLQRAGRKRAQTCQGARPLSSHGGVP